MRALFGAAALTTISSGIGLLVAIARTKLVAVVLGVYGVGILGQVNTALQFAAALVAVGFGNAIVRRTAAGDEDGDSPSSLLTTAYLAILAIVVPLVAFLLLAPSEITDRVFGEGSPALARFVLVAAIPLAAILNIETAVLRGLKNVRMLTLAISAAGILGLALLGPLVLLFGLDGALVHVALFGVASYAVTYLARRRAAWQAGLRVSLLVRPTRQALRMLLSYGSANAIAGVLNTATLLLVRSYIIGTLGVDANGIYQVLLGVPAQTLVVVFNTLSAYAFPLVSGMRERADIGGALNLILRFTLLSTTPLILGLILLSSTIVRVLYSSQFLDAADLLPIQLLGDFFKTIAWGLGLSLLGRGHLLAFTALDLGWDMTFAAGVVLLAPRLGLAGAALGYAGAYATHALATYIYQYKREGLRLDSSNLRLLAASSVVVCGAVGVAHSAQFEVRLTYTAAALIAWAWLGTQRSEWLAVWKATTVWVRPAASVR